MHKESDESLLRAVKEGSVSAFEQLVLRYQNKLCSFVTYLIRDSIVAQDVVQDTFISLYKTIDNVDDTRKFSTYVYSIARNKSISYLRSRLRHVPLETAEHISDSEQPDATLMRNDEKQRIDLALEAIDAKYKKVITLYYFEDLSYEQMSKKMRLPVNTVRTHLRRAKTALRRLLTYETT